MKSHTDVEVELYASVIFSFGMLRLLAVWKNKLDSQLIRLLLNIGMWTGHIEIVFILQ